MASAPCCTTPWSLEARRRPEWTFYNPWSRTSSEQSLCSRRRDGCGMTRPRIVNNLRTLHSLLGLWLPRLACFPFSIPPLSTSFRVKSCRHSCTLPDASAEQSAGWCRIAVNVLARADTPEKLTEAGTVLGSLHRLAQNWPQHVEITRLLATGIYNLANQFAKQGHLQAAGAGIRELCLVAGRYYGRADIAEVLATGLVNYCGDMGRIGELEAAGSCVEERRLVARRWPAHADIADKLSRGLYNYGVSLAAANRLDAASACLWELRQLAQRWPGHADLLDAAQSLDQIIASAGD